MAYTPGPWKAHRRSTPVGFAEYEIHWSEDGECVAGVVHGEDNAHLMAAAPDLLEALKNAYQLLNAFIGPDDELGQSVLNSADLAIAKAEGK
jgi:hypothetical protein